MVGRNLSETRGKCFATNNTNNRADVVQPRLPYIRVDLIEPLDVIWRDGGPRSSIILPIDERLAIKWL